MKRREAFKKLLVIPVGIALFPSCMLENKNGQKEDSSVPEKLLEEIAEIMIPPTATKGARELGLHLFALKMLNDCTSISYQKAFWNGLKEFEHLAKVRFKDSFLSLTEKEKLTFLTEINGQPKLSEIQDFFFPYKNLIIKGYLNSEYVMVNFRKYELIPGRYNGYFPVKT